jgi:hypothetical protein
VKNEAGELGFRVQVGGGMGRTPIIGSVVREFLPWQQLLNYVEACIRVYNRYGRRDNVWKARIKILVKAEGQRYIDQVEEEFKRIVEHDGAPHTITQAEYDRVAASFVPPTPSRPACAEAPHARRSVLRAHADPTCSTPAGWCATCAAQAPAAARRHAVVQAPGPGARRRRRPTSWTRRRPGRPLLRRRSPRDARPEPAAALGAPGRPARAVAAARKPAWPAPTSAC